MSSIREHVIFSRCSLQLRYSPDQMPPIERANRFMRPKREATIPALVVERSNSSEKYPAATLLTVSSTPKHAAYWTKSSQEFMLAKPCPMVSRQGGKQVVCMRERKFTIDIAIHHYEEIQNCLLYTSPSPRDGATSRMPSSA